MKTIKLKCCCGAEAEFNYEPRPSDDDVDVRAKIIALDQQAIGFQERHEPCRKAHEKQVRKSS